MFVYNTSLLDFIKFSQSVMLSIFNKTIKSMLDHVNHLDRIWHSTQ